MDRFWPGPLTIIFKKASIVPLITTGGLDTVAIRVPNHEVARLLISESGKFLAAPSANISGKPSATTASAVMQDLNEKIDAIIDGGAVEYGIESTVVDSTVSPMNLLRPGGVSLEELKTVVRMAEYSDSTSSSGKDSPKAPGMKYRHYSPSATVVLFEDSCQERQEKIAMAIDKHHDTGKRVGVISTTNPSAYAKADRVVLLGSDLAPIARNLFETFREMDKFGMDIVLVEGVAEQGVGLAIMNRIRKAATLTIK
jgi:L-threonylcarbamoyladenylate synthase